MSQFEFDAFQEECETVAGLLRQRRAGEGNAFLLKNALAQLGAYFRPVHAIVNADPSASVPQHVGTGDTAPRAALFAGLAHELQPYKKTGASGLERQVRDLLVSLEEWLGELGESVELVDAQVQRLRDKVADLTRSRDGKTKAETATARAPAEPGRSKSAPRPPSVARELSVVPGLKAGAVRMLQVLADFAPITLTKQQIGFAAHVKHSTGTFKQYWASLKANAYLLDVGAGRWTLTKEGLRAAEKTTGELASFKGRTAFFKRLLKAGAVRMLDEVIAAGNQGIMRDELGRRAGVSAETGTFKQYLGSLRSNELVLVERDAPVRLHPFLARGVVASA